MKGILLSGGLGTRLRPITKATSKQLLPVYDKPMVYYPLSMLMLAGIREILVITTPTHREAYERLLGGGRQWGLRLRYQVQDQPRGLADAFLLGRSFIGEDQVCLTLGDNIFFGHGLPDTLREAASLQEGATIFAYRVQQPERYGVVSFDGEGKAVRLVEKPAQPISPYAVPGIYFYDNRVVEFAARLTPSERGELEIMDINQQYLERGELRVIPLGRGVAWLDAGTHQSMLQASNFVQAVQERQGMMISCPEEIAFRMGYISGEELRELAAAMAPNAYREYLINLVRMEVDGRGAMASRPGKDEG